MIRQANGIPDPEMRPDFYASVPFKRVLAWVIDWVISAMIASVLLPFTFFLGVFFFPLMLAVIGFLYRWATLTGGSATLGMRLMAIELRDREGLRLDRGTAFWHVTMFYAMMLMPPALLISAVATLLTPMKQGLHDLVLGTVALNRAA